jgi:putative transposase
VQLRYQYRLYPDVAQQGLLARVFGCVRVVFNDALAARRRAYEVGEAYPSTTVLARELITVAKRTEERAWLSDAPVGVLQCALRNLDAAYKAFFDSFKGNCPGRRVGAPRFKSRRDHTQSAQFTRSDRFSITPDGRLRLPKIGDVEVRWSRDLPSPPNSVTVIKDAANRYYASFVVAVDDEPLPSLDAEIGLDLGLTHFVVDSNGVKIESPRFFRRAERKLRKAQQDLARKEKGSINRGKARVWVARAHARVRDTRRDWQHKLSTMIVRENQAIHMETLSIAGLARTNQAKSVQDAGWGQFQRMIEYKAARHGRVYHQIHRFEPSTQRCSTCQRVDGPKPLSIREWDCPACGAHHDRDVNAALNILAAGQAERLNACGAVVRPGPSIPRARRTAAKQETTRVTP